MKGFSVDQFVRLKNSKKEALAIFFFITKIILKGGLRCKMTIKEQREDRIRVLELTLQEQRKDFDFLNSIYEQVKVKNITFLAASLGVLAYLYTGTSNGSLKAKLFIPTNHTALLYTP